MTKALLASLALLALAAVGRAQQEIPVYLDPDASSPRIGSLESRAMAVSAQWPVGSDALPGWQPVHYRGAFEVYVHNNDIAKDVTVKPGSPYLLAPSNDAAALAVATEADRSDILSVDTYFCKLRLETIVTGFIREQPRAASLQPAAEPPRGSSPGGAQPKDLVGKLLKVGNMEQLRVGRPYKLVSPAGRPIAYVDVSQVSDRVHVEGMVGTLVRVSGLLSENAEEDYLVIDARSLKKAN